LILTQVGLIDLFDAIIDGTQITKSKPNPEVFLKAAELLHK
jgi:beta-phosphoglucomutase